MQKESKFSELIITAQQCRIQPSGGSSVKQIPVSYSLPP